MFSVNYKEDKRLQRVSYIIDMPIISPQATVAGKLCLFFVDKNGF